MVGDVLTSGYSGYRLMNTMPSPQQLSSSPCFLQHLSM
jgi:hypothetical protein